MFPPKQGRRILWFSVSLACSTLGRLDASTPWLHVDGKQIEDPAGHRVVLRGVSLIDLGATEKLYGGAMAMIDRLTDKADTSGGTPGWFTRVVRIACYPPDGDFKTPFGWEKGSTDFYERLLRPVVDYCRAKDVYAIIDWHCIADTAPHDSTTRDFWSDMAPRFANDSHVLFEVYNEPIEPAGDETGRWIAFRKTAQPWVDQIRSKAPRNLILVGGPNWSQIIGPAAEHPFSGGNIVYVSHVYPGHFRDPGARNWILGHITACSAKHPVMLTEWGFSEKAPKDITGGDAAGYGQPFKEFVDANRLGWTAWCANDEWLPPMFNEDHSLRVGPAEMGGFTKAWLYQRRNDDRPKDK
jgi:hypothetical protein